MNMSMSAVAYCLSLIVFFGVMSIFFHSLNSGKEIVDLIYTTLLLIQTMLLCTAFICSAIERKQ